MASPTSPPASPASPASLYPAHLQLRLVQVLLRHGERTPIDNQILALVGLPDRWPLCARRLVHTRTSSVTHPETGRPEPIIWTADTEDEHPDGRDVQSVVAPPAASSTSEGSGPAAATVAATAATVGAGVCGWGALTDRGRRSTFELGRRLRDLYVTQLGFLPENIDTDRGGAEMLHLRSTGYQRAFESLMHTTRALYPAQNLSGETPLRIVVRPSTRESLVPEVNCRRLSQIKRLFGIAVAKSFANSPDLAAVQTTLAPWLSHDPAKPAVGITLDSQVPMTRLMDAVAATQAHRGDAAALRLPAPFYDPTVIATSGRASCELYFRPYSRLREARVLGPGRLLAELTSRMADAAGGKGGALRLALFGCHDSTLGSALASLGVFDWKWPPFTSTLAFELFQAKAQPKTGWQAWVGGSESGGEHYVRIQYNGNSVTVPGCGLEGNHLPGDKTFCKLDAFKAIVDKFTPADRASACEANLGAQLNEAEEPSGY